MTPTLGQAFIRQVWDFSECVIVIVIVQDATHLPSDSHDVSDTVRPCQEHKDASLLPASPPLDVTTLPSTLATSNVQTDVESPQLGASVSFTFPRLSQSCSLLGLKVSQQL